MSVSTRIGRCFVTLVGGDQDVSCNDHPRLTWLFYPKCRGERVLRAGPTSKEPPNG